MSRRARARLPWVAASVLGPLLLGVAAGPVPGAARPSEPLTPAPALASTPAPSPRPTPAPSPTSTPAPAPTPPPAPTSTGLELGLLQTVPSAAEDYAAAGVDRVTLEVGWDAYAPAPGVTNREYVTAARAEAARYHEAGLGVVLDLGLQYPPTWAWELPGPTRFVDQHGQTWRGGIGTDPLNAVWNPSVREAQSAYVHALAADLTGVDLDAVRVGGLLSGESRYPPAGLGGHADSLWGFDEYAVQASPVPGWVPGQGTPAEAQAWLDHYLDALAGHLAWLTELVAEAFPGTPVDVLLPGWGLRPGDVERTAQELARLEAVAATGNDLSEGVDWARQVCAVASTGLDVTLVTTWLDAPEHGPGPGDRAPVAHLSELAAGVGLPVAGENTGGGGLAALERTADQAQAHGLVTVTWMSASTLDEAEGPSLAELGAAFRGPAAPASSRDEDQTDVAPTARAPISSTSDGKAGITCSD